MKTTVYNIAIAVLAAAMLTACVFENDMSYPRIYAGITSFAVEGQKSSTIDGDTRTVQIVLGETADRTALKVTEAAISQEARCPDFPSAGDVIDLSGSVTYVLSTYQDYEWTVSATQPIERYVNCENSASAPIIDSDMKMAHVYVLVSQSLQDIGVFIEAFASASYHTVKDAYYEISLTLKYVNDPDSREMLQLMDSTVYVDAVNFLNNNGDNSIRLSTNALRSIYESGFNTVINKIDSWLEGDMERLERINGQVKELLGVS